MFSFIKSAKSKWLVGVIIVALVVALLGVYIPAVSVQAYSGFPTFSIVSVVKDTSVTILTNNLPPDQTFTVRMGLIGTRAVGGTIVATTDSGVGGAQTLTYNIPAGLKGQAQISIRMDSNLGYFAYNWFNNSSIAAGTPSPTVTPGYTGIPTFSISAVVEDTSVTIKTNNFPADRTFTVRMGAYGTRAIGGIVVGTQTSGTGGVFEATYTIPAALKGSTRIAIRMDSTTGGFFAYNWFWNSTATVSTGTVTPVPSGTVTPTRTATPGGPTATPSYAGFPTFSISAVVKDTSVTIAGKNFPPNQTFTVRMGAYGTLGIGGIVVGTLSSGTGGSLTATFNIPSALQGSTKIAIRMDSPQGYFAYNWFWNNNAP